MTAAAKAAAARAAAVTAAEESEAGEKGKGGNVLKACIELAHDDGLGAVRVDQ